MLLDTFSLFFPHNCAACGEALLKNEKTICVHCVTELPFTRFSMEKNNPVEKLFWGKIKIESAASLCYFSKSTRVQNLLHELKYKGNLGVGEFLGKELGKEILCSQRFSSVDLILPVPLHEKKEKIRGYNQSALIAEGVSCVMEKEVSYTAVKRNRETSTQTRKSRFERWLNTRSVFGIEEKEKLEGKHILIIDDVITTGSTIEALVNEILQVKNTKVSVATAACA